MKTLLLIILVWFWIPETMQSNFRASNFETTINIKPDLLTIKTVLPGWDVQHIKTLKKGVNVYDCAIDINTRIEIKIWKNENNH